MFHELASRLTRDASGIPAKEGEGEIAWKIRAEDSSQEGEENPRENLFGDYFVPS